MMRLRTLDWIRTFFRSLYLQAAWNYPSMLALGFVSAMMPAMRRLCSTPEERKAFLLRHLEFFNAHPYFASFAIGASLRLEESGREEDIGTISSMKSMLVGPLGSLGDQLFWNGIRPLVGMVGAMAALRGHIWGPVFFLAVYNIPHIYVRYRGLKKGYQLGAEVSDELLSPMYRRALAVIRIAGAVCLGFLISFEGGRLLQIDINHLILFVLFIILCRVALKKRIPLYGIGAGALIIGYLVIIIMNRTVQ